METPRSSIVVGDDAGLLGFSLFDTPEPLGLSRRFGWGLLTAFISLHSRMAALLKVWRVVFGALVHPDGKKGDSIHIGFRILCYHCLVWHIFHLNFGPYKNYVPLRESIEGRKAGGRGVTIQI